MTAKVNLCGHADPNLGARNCLNCKAISQARWRANTRPPKIPKGQPTCRTCRMRYAVKPPETRDAYNPMLLTAKEVAWLENAARLFDQFAGDERFTAEEFMAWLKPDLNGKWPRLPVYEGVRRQGDSPNSADPLPVVPMKLRKLVS